MSLFPNESYSFPDLSEGAKKLRLSKASPEPPEESETLPEGAIEELQVGDEQGPAAESFQAPIPVSQISSPETINPAGPVRPTAPALPADELMPVIPAVPVVPDQLAEPIPDYVEEAEFYPIETIEEDVPEPDFEFQAWDAENYRANRRRRRNKLIRFLVLEIIVIALLLGSAKLAVMDRYSENSLSTLYSTLVVIAAIAAAIIPVLFYALPPTLPGDKH